MNPTFSINAGAKSGVKAITIAVSSIALLLSMSAISGANAQAAPQYPGKRVPGVSKSDSRAVTCPIPPLGITALVPELDAKTSTKTTVEDPIVWVYVPYAKSETNRFNLELRVTDPTGQITRRKIALPKTAGIMPIFLPTETKLAIGQSYRWVLRATCEENNPLDIRLTIDRIAALPKEPSTTTRPSQAKIDFYAERSIWLNAMTEVIKFNGKRPTLTPDAQNFLLKKLDGGDFKNSGLESDYLQKITQQPIVK